MVCIYHFFLCIHLATDIEIISISWLQSVMLQWILRSRYLFDSDFSSFHYIFFNHIIKFLGSHMVSWLFILLQNVLLQNVLGWLCYLVIFPFPLKLCQFLSLLHVPLKFSLFRSFDYLWLFSVTGCAKIKYSHNFYWITLCILHWLLCIYIFSVLMM